MKSKHGFHGYSRASLLPGNKPGRRASTYQIYTEKYAQNAKYKTEAWKRLSKLVRREDPYCFLCISVSQHTLAQSVDHIDGDTNNDKRQNLLSLCDHCHAWKTVTFEKCKSEKLLTAFSERPPLPSKSSLDLLSELSYNRLVNPNPLLASIIALHYQAFNMNYEW